MGRLKIKPSFHSCDTVQGFGLGWCYTLKEGILLVLPVVCMLLFCMPTEAAALPSASGDDATVEEVVDDTITALPGSVSGGDSSGQDLPQDELDSKETESDSEAYNTIISLLTEDSSDEVIIYDSQGEFEALPATVTRYEYEILQRLEFLQYAVSILIGLIFILIFKKK